MIGEMIIYPMAKSRKLRSDAETKLHLPITDNNVVKGKRVPHATLDAPYLTPNTDRGVLPNKTSFT